MEAVSSTKLATRIRSPSIDLRFWDSDTLRVAFWHVSAANGSREIETTRDLLNNVALERLDQDWTSSAVHVVDLSFSESLDWGVSWRTDTSDTKLTLSVGTHHVEMSLSCQNG